LKDCDLSKTSKMFFERLKDQYSVFIYSAFNKSKEAVVIYKKPFLNKKTKRWIIGHYVDDEVSAIEYDNQSGMVLQHSLIIGDEDFFTQELDNTLDDFLGNISKEIEGGQ